MTNQSYEINHHIRTSNDQTADNTLKCLQRIVENYFIRAASEIFLPLFFADENEQPPILQRKLSTSGRNQRSSA